MPRDDTGVRCLYRSGRGEPAMADKTAKRIAELIKPLRLKPRAKVNLAKDFNLGYKAGI
jgi:hypothetical protein